MARFVAQKPTGAAVQELEGLVRHAVFKPATGIVGWLLQQAADSIDRAYQPRPGEQRKGRQRLEVQCLFGWFSLERDYYHRPGPGGGHHPADAALGLEGSQTPALARLICLEGADEPGFEKAQRHLAETGGIAVEARQIQRMVQRVGACAQQWQERASVVGGSPGAPILYVSADGTGVPMRSEALAGRAGKQADGSSKTLQAYLGCVFTQHHRDEQGRPVRDPDSTTYVTRFGSIHEFGPMLRREALRRGMGQSPQVVLLIDGASGLEGMGTDCFSNAIQIVDFFHAMEHAGEVVEALLGTKDHPEYRSGLSRWARRLLKDGVEGLIHQSREDAQKTGRTQAVNRALHYFETNVKRMQYGTFRAAGYFIGSGVVEAGCRSVIGLRCKQSGMRWSPQGASRILALRCVHSSRRLDSFWKHRLHLNASLNDTLCFHA
ncbi:MAG: ISKra4 family transposase [Deltaproteobacteria bacterium]|nr:ISKra4 family transposase [Deltaproteobacteria bacterium]